MTFFPSLPDKANVSDIYKLNPEIRRAMAELGRIIMRGESALSPAQRETIAAYVSGLNQCAYCYNGHSQMAINLGMPREIIESVIEDVDDSKIDEAFKPILRFAKKLTLRPHAITQSDADAVFAAGWSERALHDAILVVCRFNYMNRLTLGHGLDPQAEDASERAQRMSYAKPESKG